MTQRERVLRALQTAGPRGVTQVDFLRFPTVDGGPPITRLAARIQELKDAGHRIGSSATRDKCAVYVWTDWARRGDSSTLPAAPTSTAAVNPAEDGAAGTLFNPALGSSPAGAYDDLEAA